MDLSAKIVILLIEKRVRLHYQAGMEALIKQVNDELKSHGLMPVIIRPGSMADRSYEFSLIRWNR